MLTLQVLRNDRDALAQALAKRGIDAAPMLDRILSLDEERRHTQKEVDDLKAQQNAASREIGELFKSGKKDEAEQRRADMGALKEKIHALDEQQKALIEQQESALLELPNRPHDSVPAGQSDADNEVVSEEGARPELGDAAVPHWELADRYKLIDFEAGVKITGAGFPVYRGKGAKLQRALIQFFLDRADQAGYEEFIPPHLVNPDSARGTGQLPDKEGQMYHCADDDLYLIPTAEVPLTNLFRGNLLSAEELPVQLCGYTPCFRREAGSYGKDVRGLNRLHQFDKVEIVRFEKPENSYAALEGMVEHVRGLLRDLELPFRTLRLCGGDLGFTAALTFDLEVWSGAQGRWLEVSSVSNFETFQANRLHCRYRNSEGKPQLVHTLNGSALALPRIVAALLENHQTPEGIRIPAALQPYTGFTTIS
ncbi:MAG: serine--tRNA ligase [Flavobacteriales bacterium]|nr:serine--tRNA ligase [Flavobacteriales bacterium]